MPASVWIINRAVLDAVLGRRITSAPDHNMAALVRVRGAELAEPVASGAGRSSCWRVAR